ncbi:MAG: glycerol-3-phosphate dehydrogenase [marine bacterium B5-7]|nr:MAG: glycerol-3-phosphate dehydrogenase [marine bacterium B5-7]
MTNVDVGWNAPLGERYDIVVIGGGIHGVCVTYEAARRGLSVLLLERKDFGSGTSSNSMKIVHGGLRYMQDFDFKRVIDSNREFRILQHIAPALVQPLSCQLDVRGRGVLFSLKFRSGLALYNAIAKFAARAVPSALDVPASHYPGWYDGIILDTEEFLLSYLHTAFREESGKVAFRNHVGDVTVMCREGRAVAVTTASTGPIEAGAIIECVGVAREGQPVGMAMNLIVDRLDLNAGAIARGFVHPHDGRSVFTVPWRDASIVGTFERSYSGDPREALSIDPEVIDEFLAWLAPVHAEFAKLTRGDVRFVHAGLLPKDAHESEELSRASKVDETEDGRIRVLGVKYTTSRALASQAIQRAATHLDKSVDDALDRLVPLISRSALVREFTAEYPKLSRPLAGGELTEGDVVFAVRHELAVDLTDVLFRRTRVANAGHPGDTLIHAVAGMMASLIGWTDSEKQKQIEQFEDDIHFTGGNIGTVVR